MEKKTNEEELQSRREFFKKAAKGALPLFGIAVLGPSILSSCGGGDDKDSGSSCKDCSGSCNTGCSGDCDSGCEGDCWGGCYNKYKN